jgi:hypothetical protein
MTPRKEPQTIRNCLLLATGFGVTVLWIILLGWGLIQGVAWALDKLPMGGA